MKLIKAMLSPKMLVMLAFGFSSGWPYLITRDILKMWMTESKVDLGTIGLFSLVALPYSLKFLWSPFMDRYSFKRLGRRRGWMIVSQLGLAFSIGLLGQFDPKIDLFYIAVMALVVSFFSASQDIIIDAHRREYLKDSELGLGSALYMNAFRGANMASLALAFIGADHLGFSTTYLLLAAVILLGTVVVLFTKEPEVIATPPRSLKEAVVGPFQEFFHRPGAWLVLAFILLYKLGDNLAAALNVPFVRLLGFEKTDYLVIVKGVGMASLFGGMFLGGILLMRISLYRALIYFGFLQMISIGGFALLSVVGKNTALLTFAVAFELFSAGLGTSAYSTFMALQTHTRFTATQYALMTSLMAVPGSVASAVTGYLASWFGWSGFYFFCMVAAVPGILLIRYVCPKDFGTKRAAH
ncbi:MAG: MFS transporter [Bdellovibrionales bacterium]|nr:MFS transporter [Bdellovibrionales bacterium]